MGHPTAQGPGWWQASDGHWYAPHLHPAATLTPPPIIGGTAAASSTLGNLLWLALAGWWLCLAYLLAGVVNCMTIIGIPFGLQSFKLAGYALWPFGRAVIDRPHRDAGLSCLGNVIWFLIGGAWLALGHLLAGLLLCATVIGIPLGVASIKMAGIALAPFGKQVVSRSQLASMPGTVVVMNVR